MKLGHGLQNGCGVHLQAIGETAVHRLASGYTFEIALKGKLSVNFEQKKHLIYTDSFIVLAPGTNYQLKCGSIDRAQILSINFPAAYIGSRIADAHVMTMMPIQSMFPFRGDLRYTVINLAKRLRQDPDAPEILIERYLEHFLISYFRLYHDEIVERLASLSFAREITKREVFAKLILAKEYLLNNYNKCFSIEEVASYSCLSVNHLLRTFKQAYGISPYRYLTLIRLNRARLYLENEKYSINETVTMVGFESVSSFIKLFKATFNTTPLKYRRQSTTLKGS